MTIERRTYSQGMRWFGIILIVLGVLGLFDQFFNIRLGRFIWPFFILVPGVLLIVLTLRTERDTGEPFVMLGSLVTLTGLLLFYQNLTGHWASWAYAWALVAPTGVGLGQWLYGTANGRPGMVKSGRDLISIGLLMFAVGFVFFELLLNISGLNFGPAGWGILLILLGGFMLLRPLLSRSRER